MLDIAGSPLGEGAIGGSTLSMVPSIGGLVSTQSSSKSSQASSVDMPPASGVSGQASSIDTPPASGVSGQASSIDTPPASGVSSQTSSVNIPLAMPNMGIPTAIAPGLHHAHVSVHLLRLITGDETDIVVSPETGNVMLTLQHPMVRLVIQDSVDILHSLLLSENAFPNGASTIVLIKEALVRSCQNHAPGAAHIQQRLENDNEYFGRIMPLVSLMNVLGHSS